MRSKRRRTHAIQTSKGTCSFLNFIIFFARLKFFALFPSIWKENDLCFYFLCCDEVDFGDGNASRRWSRKRTVHCDVSLLFVMISSTKAIRFLLLACYLEFQVSWASVHLFPFLTICCFFFLIFSWRKARKITFGARSISTVCIGKITSPGKLICCLLFLIFLHFEC